TTFNSNVGSAVGTSGPRAVTHIVVQPDGKILIAGEFTTFNGSARGGLARLTNARVLDTGIAPTSHRKCNTIFLAPDGSMIVGGNFSTFDGVSASSIVRISTSNVVDTSFVAQGGLNTGKNIYSLALQANGKLLLGSEQYAKLQGSAEGNSLWRIFPGLSALP